MLVLPLFFLCTSLLFLQIINFYPIGIFDRNLDFWVYKFCQCKSNLRYHSWLCANGMGTVLLETEGQDDSRS